LFFLLPKFIKSHGRLTEPWLEYSVCKFGSQVHLRLNILSFCVNNYSVKDFPSSCHCYMSLSILNCFLGHCHVVKGLYNLICCIWLNCCSLSSQISRSISNHVGHVIKMSFLIIRLMSLQVYGKFPLVFWVLEVVVLDVSYLQEVSLYKPTSLIPC
jgi:hypothetical protein